MDNMEWVETWGNRFGVRNELRSAFSSSAARALVRNFEQEGFDPEVLAFAFVRYILPDRQKKKGLPLRNDFKDGEQRVTSLKRWLAAHGPAIGVPQLGGVLEGLNQLGAVLRNRQICIPVGNMVVFERLDTGHPKKERTTRRVMFFLVGYFRLVEDRSPRWALITDFLILTMLTGSRTSSRSAGKKWSAMINRPSQEPIEPYQEALIADFNDAKNDVRSQSSIL